MLEVIFHTEADRQRATMDYVFPDYVPKETIDQIWQEKLSDFVVFIPPRCKKWAREHKYFPVRYVQHSRQPG